MEDAAEKAQKSASAVVSHSRVLVKAAKTGNIAAIKRIQDRLQETTDNLKGTSKNSVFNDLIR